MNKKLSYALLPLSAAAGMGAAQAQTQDKPNIIIILADDLGFSDVGCYGGEINTPNIDRLAYDGVRLTQIYNSARSCPTRASLMTGLYPHQTGLGHMTGNHTDGRPRGYAGFRNESDNVMIPEVLKEAGYYTAMSGKWHISNGEKGVPTARGFEDYFGLVGGFDSFWNKNVYRRLPKGAPEREYAEDEFYATNAITDYAVDFINKAKQIDKPLFLYLAYNAPHFPLHAPKEVTDKYMDTYMQGWDKIRAQRFKRQQELGVLQGDPEMSLRGDVPESFFMHESYPLPAWDDLTLDQQKDLARRMAIFAAMVDIMDQGIGRVLETLEQNGQMDNTLILFMSDNGACAEWHEFGFDRGTGTFYHTHVGDELDGMGLKGTYHHYGTGWANVGNTPHTLYKHFAHEGGISSPSILWWGDNVKKKGSIDHQPLHITDVMATCVDVADAKYPAKYEGREIHPMVGTSFARIAKGKKLPKRYIYAEHEGNRMVRHGDMKLVSAHYLGDVWQLYNIRRDRTEQHDLAAKSPKTVKKMEKAYLDWAKRSDVVSFAPMWNKYAKPKPPLKEYTYDKE